MPVQFIYDEFGVDSERGVRVKSTEDVIAIRQQIDRHLQTHAAELLQVRLDNPALWRRFNDYEGLDGVLPTQRLIPRIMLAQALKTELPDWLNDELIVKLGLLHKKFATSVTHETMAEAVLHALSPGLLSTDFLSFIAALNQHGGIVLQLLAIPQINEQFRAYLVTGLALNESTAQRFIAELLNAKSIAAFLQHLAYQQQVEHLRRFIGARQLNLALPAKMSDADLLQALPLLPLSEEQANGLADKYLLALEAIERKIHANEAGPEVLADWLVDWPSLLNAIAEKGAEQRTLLSPALVSKLQTFASGDAQALLAKIQHWLAGFPALDAKATVDEAVSWSAGYFDYCRQAFLDGLGLDEAINLSFTDWLLAAQAARIPRSNYGWRAFSGKVKAYLQQGYVTVIIMVDALSALNKDTVLNALHGLDALVLHEAVLFAPLPTLTEVGKMAVLTGLSVQEQPSGNQEAILRQSYQNYLPTPDALKVLNSWSESSERIKEATQLLVYFENRLDERLHDCPSFHKHRADIQPIMKQIRRSLDSWRKDAALLNKEIVFFITADHGMTVTQSLYQGEALGDCKERVYKLKHSPSLPHDFVLLDGYAIPKPRYRLAPDAALAHGGLTPEEVLIPCITLTSKPPQLGRTPLEIQLLANPCVRAGPQDWYLNLQLNAQDKDLTAIDISLSPPFSGKESLDSLRAHKSQKLTLRFSSGHEQEGLTELGILLAYRYIGGSERATKTVTVQFPPALIEKDKETRRFEDMF